RFIDLSGSGETKKLEKIEELEKSEVFHKNEEDSLKIKSIDEFIIKTESSVDLIPSENSLSGLEVELVELHPLARTQKLKEILAKIDKENDYILIYCTSSLGHLSINSIVARKSI